MKRAYKYKMKPTDEQKQLLSQAFGCARFIYNWGLDRKKTAYETEKKKLSYVDIAKEMTLLKKQEEYKWLNDVANEMLQQSLRNMSAAYDNFFKQHKGYPKFKSKKNSRDSVKYVQCVHFDFNEWKVKIPRIGWINICKNRAFVQSNTKQGTCTVSRDHCGTYWCVIITDDGIENTPKTKVIEETAVGIDLGIKDYAILSDGTKYGNPKFLEKGQRKLAILQKKFARTKKDSKRHEAMRMKVARQYRKINNRREHFLHDISSAIINNYDTVCLENLNIKGMVKNHYLANSIQSAAWGEFKRQLEYKAEWNGKNIITIGRFEPSTKTCSHCGYVNNEITLKDRSWVCPNCGTRHDRDVNAAKNILRMGMEKEKQQ